MASILAILSIFAVVAIGLIWRGFVLSVLWGWFIIPVFPAMPVLSIPVAIGIAIVVSFLTYQLNSKEKSDQPIQQMGVALLYPGVVLILGWIVTFFL